MNKNLLIIIIVSLLASIGVYFLMSNNQSPSNNEQTSTQETTQNQIKDEEKVQQNDFSEQSPSSNADEIERELDNLDSDSDLEIEEDIE